MFREGFIYVSRMKARRIGFVFVTAFLFLCSVWYYNRDFSSSLMSNYNHFTPFYGLNHRDTYGLPLTYFTTKSFQSQKKDWKIYFPQTLSALHQLKVQNPNANADLFTRSYVVTYKKTSYKIGDEFFATITSINGNGKPKGFGGDYYRARLIRRIDAYPDGIPCRVTDNNDGTYSVKVPLVLQGALKLDVKLVYSIETIHEVVNQTEVLTSWGLPFRATLESGENVTCNVDLTTQTG